MIFRWTRPLSYVIKYVKLEVVSEVIFIRTRNLGYILLMFEKGVEKWEVIRIINGLNSSLNLAFGMYTYDIFFTVFL